MFFATLLAASLAPAPTDCRIVAFSRDAILAHAKQEVCVEPGDVAGRFVLHRTSTALNSAASETLTNTRDCPAVLPLLGEMEQLELPRPDFPGVGQQMEFITLDGAAYNLTAPALYEGRSARLMVHSNVNTPLARWIDRTLKVLEPCWRPKD